MLKSCEKSLHYYRLALEDTTEKIQHEINQSMNFAYLLWNKPEYFKPDGTLSNELFFYIRKSNKSEALRTIQKIDFNSLTSHRKGFHCFYSGLLHNDQLHFYDSIKWFNKSGEKFYKQLPILELKKRGVNDLILNALSS